jgi:uncharacterized protein YjbI with pentapeptide repeats
MKEEILKILEMSKNGIITDSEAAELLATLKGNDQKIHTDIKAKNESFSGDKFEKNIKSGITDFVNSVLGKAFNEVDKSISQERHNKQNLSRVDNPKGEDYTFDDNSFQVSSAKGIELKSSRLTDNSFNASNVDGLSLSDSIIEDTSFNGSSLDEVILIGAKIIDTSFNGAKVSKFLMNNSTIKDVSFHGVNIKGLDLLNQSKFEDCVFQGATLIQTQFDLCVIEDAKLSGTSFKETTFDNCSFKDIQLNDLKIWGCKLKNVHLSDINLSNVVIENKEFNSTEEFFNVFGK